MDNDLWFRRVNVRQVIVFPNTRMYDVGLRYLRKNYGLFRRFRYRVRHVYEKQMLERILPKYSVVRDVYVEKYLDRRKKIAYCRQAATYPILIKAKVVEEREMINVVITGHEERSIKGVQVI